MIPNIEKQISALGEAVIKSIQERFTVGEVVPYPYQCVAYAEIAKRMKNYKHPFFVKASVSAGKTLMFAMVAHQCRKMGLKRRTEDKSAYFPIVVGAEGTVVNGLFKALGDYVPHVIGIDECHRWIGKTLPTQTTKKGEKVPNPDYDITKGSRNRNTEFLIGEDGLPMEGTGRTQYTVIIMEMMRRCRKAYGHELRIFGMTGSEFRGVVPIPVEDKSRKDSGVNRLLILIPTTPTNFGDVGDLGYDLSEFEASSEDGVADFDAKTLRRMEQKFMKKRPCRRKALQRGSGSIATGTTYRIITGKTGDNQRKEWLREAYEGKVKYIFRVQALTTGVNVPFWDTSVILRKIGSLTLLIQLLGRGMRLLKKWHKEQGFKKDDHLVMDFSGTMDELGSFILIRYWSRRSTRSDSGTVKIRSRALFAELLIAIMLAVVCTHVDENDNRCEWFFKFRTCDDQIDPRTKRLFSAAVELKSLIDPNEKLSGKHYTKTTGSVQSFSVDMTKNQKGIIFNYELSDGIDTFRAREIFSLNLKAKFAAQNGEALLLSTYQIAVLLAWWRAIVMQEKSLIDPNEKLSGKHYTKTTGSVQSFSVDMTKNQKGIIFNYELSDGIDTFRAREIFSLNLKAKFAAQNGEALLLSTYQIAVLLAWWRAIVMQEK
ncbi:UNVERIFIED_ASMBLY: DNA helicase [Shigella phage 2019SD1]|uniref:DNA helicase n=1 Tax=Shigella phage 2019SD1 TaxID=2848074 RepID=A0A6M5CDH7_9CAUD|nr:DNA helicase [Shigella phage 2019SD1]